MEWKRYLTEKNVFIISLFFGVIVLCAPLIVREASYNGIILGDISYYHMRIAQTILTSGIPSTDEAILGGRAYHTQPYHLLLAFFGAFFGVATISKILPFLLGILTLIFFYLILKKLGTDSKLMLVSLLIFVFSPLFIATFSYSDTIALVVFLQVFAFYLFISENSVYYSLAVYTVIPFFGLKHAIAASFFALVFSHHRRTYTHWALAFVFMIPALLFFNRYFPSSVSGPLFLTYLQHFFSDLGSAHGFGAFNVALFLVGFAPLWNKSKLFVLGILAVFCASFIWVDYFYYLNFFVAIAGAYGFLYLLEREWHLHFLKELTVLIVICGLLFSGISFMNRMVQNNPSSATIDSLRWLHDNTRQGDVVLSHPKFGYWISSSNKGQILSDGLSVSPALSSQQFYDIFYTRNVKTASEFMDNYHISYIYLPRETREGLLWSKDKEGLQFVLYTSDNFVKLYSGDDVDIWAYLPKGG